MGAQQVHFGKIANNRNTCQNYQETAVLETIITQYI